MHENHCSKKLLSDQYVILTQEQNTSYPGAYKENHAKHFSFIYRSVVKRASVPGYKSGNNMIGYESKLTVA